MKKRLIIITLLLVVALGTMIAFTGCGTKHEFSTDWSKDETCHWHACTTKKHTDVADKAEHVYDNDADITCNVCGYVRPEHTHVAAGEWTTDETKHWKVCTVSGCGEKLEVGAHTYDAGVITTEPTYTAPGVKTFTCTVCGYNMTQTVEALQKSEPTLAFVADLSLNKPYDKTAVTVSAEQYTYNGDGDVSVLWFDSDKNAIETAPVNADKYFVKLSATEGATCKSATSDYFAVEISPVVLAKGAAAETCSTTGRRYLRRPIRWVAFFRATR